MPKTMRAFRLFALCLDAVAKNSTRWLAGVALTFGSGSLYLAREYLVVLDEKNSAQIGTINAQHERDDAVREWRVAQGLQAATLVRADSEKIRADAAFEGQMKLLTENGDLRAKNASLTQQIDAMKKATPLPAAGLLYPSNTPLMSGIQSLPSFTATSDVAKGETLHTLLSNVSVQFLRRNGDAFLLIINGKTERLAMNQKFRTYAGSAYSCFIEVTRWNGRAVTIHQQCDQT